MQLPSTSFSGHESFVFRNTWLTKGILACSKDPGIFARDDAMVRLGVGKNMVQSIRHWCLATRLLWDLNGARSNRGRQLQPTTIAGRLFLGGNGLPAWDPYLEDTGTLWLIHWLLVTNERRATTWLYAFNFFSQPEFTRRSLEQAIADVVSHMPTMNLSPGTLRRDIDVFLRTYVTSTSVQERNLEDSLDCPLTELGLIHHSGWDVTYAFSRGPKDSLPDPVFIYALSEYARNHPAQRSFTFDHLAYSPLSPGRVFRLDELALAERLDRLPSLTGGAWRFTETAGYKQLMLIGEVDPISVLGTYYEGRSSTLAEVRL